MKTKVRIKKILSKIEAIEKILAKDIGKRYWQNIMAKYNGKIALALRDDIESRPAILMHFIAIAEQVRKLEDSEDVEVLSCFAKEDLKGLQDVRNFIAHDYDGVDIGLIEHIIRYGLENVKASALDALHVKDTNEERCKKFEA